MGGAYCYARPTHEYLDFGAGTDFERKLVVKPEVAALLEAQFDHPKWKGELVVFSGNTDCYQPLEASWGLTRACLDVCLRYRNPVGIITKSTLIERDLELLAELGRTTHLTSLCVSRTTKRWKRMRRDRIARALSGLRRVLWARVQMGRRPDGPGSGAPRTLADVSY